MRLLSVIPQLGAGGAEVVAATLAVDARLQGHDVRLASADGFRVAALAEAGVGHVPVPLDGRRPRDLARSVRRLRSFRGPGGPDVVHAHNVKAALVARLAFGGQVPVLTTLHGVPAAELGHAARMLGWTSDRVVAVSPYVAAQLEVYGFPPSRCRVVENAVVSPPSYPRRQAREELGLAPDAVVGLCLARFVDQKRHDLLVAAAARLTARPVLLLAGDGATRPGVAEAVGRHRLGDSVRLLGERTDVDRLLAAADFLVLPTDWEGLPISLLEAMSVGLPVVVSRVGGVVETLGAAVRLAEPGSATALAEALADVIGDGQLRAELGRRGRALVAERFGPDRMLDAYRTLYDELAGVPSQPVPSLLTGSGS
jgi:glycosyltransferase involved in cell wall biosynthesis